MEQDISDILMDFYFTVYHNPHSGVVLLQAQTKAVAAILRIIKCKKV